MWPFIHPECPWYLLIRVEAAAGTLWCWCLAGFWWDCGTLVILLTTCSCERLYCSKCLNAAAMRYYGLSHEDDSCFRSKPSDQNRFCFRNPVGYACSLQYSITCFHPNKWTGWNHQSHSLVSQANRRRQQWPRTPYAKSLCLNREQTTTLKKKVIKW